MAPCHLQKRFGQRLSQIRKSLRVTQSNLAESCGISEEYLSKIERGLASPSFDVISRLCRGLNIEPVNLFSGIPAGNDTDPAQTLLVADSSLYNIFQNIPFGFFISTYSGRFQMASDLMAIQLGFGSGAAMAQAIEDIARDLYACPDERFRLLSQIPEDGSLFIGDSVLKSLNKRRLNVRLYMRQQRRPGDELRYLGAMVVLGENSAICA